MRARDGRIVATVAAAAAALALSLPAGAVAATIPVNTTFDENGGPGSTGCALREAIMAANSDTAVGGCPAGSGVDTVTVPGGTYALTIEGAGENLGQTGDLDVTGSLTLTGAGAAATVIDAGSTATSFGGARDRVFDVRAPTLGGTTTATIERVTIRGGRTPAGLNGPDFVGEAGSGAGVPGGVGEGGRGQDVFGGGGVRNLETLTLRAVTVTGNTTGAGGAGGLGMGGSGGAGGPGGLGIGGAGGRGGDGGGILTFGRLTIESSTVSGNRTGDGGRGGQAIGGVANAGGDGGGATGGLGARAGDGGGVAAVAPDPLLADPELTILDSTIAGNATGAGGAGGIGVATSGADGVSGGNGGVGGNAGGGAGGAGGDGGGVSDAKSITGTTIEDNTTGSGGNGGGAQAGPGGDGDGAGADGAGGDAVGHNGGRGGAGGGAMGTISITSSTIADNTTGAGGSGGSATGGVGGGGGPGGDGAGGHGGFGGDGGGLASPNQFETREVVGSTLTGNVTGDGGNGAAGTAGAGGAGGTAGGATGGDGGGGGGGGGLQTRATGTELLTNVTIVGNGTGAGGNGTGDGAGGRGGDGAVSSRAGDLRILHGTVGETTLGAGGAGAPAGSPGGGSAVSSSGAKDEVTTVANTILLGSCFSAADGGNNLDPAGGSCPGATGDPLLGPLADNGGPTRTRAPQPGSAAVDAVPAGGAGCTPTDQRGATRPGGAACEIGAYELAPPGAITGPAEDVGLTGARLTGTVEPRGLTTSYRFDFGPTAAYGNATPTETVPATAAPVPVSAAIGGLAPETTVHYRLVAIGRDGTTLGADRTFTTIDPTAPSLTGVSLSRKRFGVGRDPTPVIAAQRRVPRGTRIRFNLSETASVAIAVQRRAPGLRLRRRGGRTRCVAPTPRNRRRTLGRQVRCVRFVRRGTLTRSGQAGRNSVRFSGRIGRRALRPGRHRFSLVATDPQGNRSVPRRVSFTIVRTPRK